MADDAGKLTSEEVIQFFSDIGATQRCPVCAQRAWALPAREVEKVVGLFGQKKDGSLKQRSTFTSPGTVIPTITVLCTNCGYLRLHALSTVWEKIRGSVLYE